MLKLKAPLIIAGAACILSMLIGLISGVRFLNILGRGLIAGIGAGSFVLCARIILERFIPDIFAPPVSSDTVETADVPSGSNINITVDDDLDVTAAIMTGDNAETTGALNFTGTQEEAQSTDTASIASTPDVTDNGNVHEAAGLSDSSTFPLNDSPQSNNTLADLPNMGSFMDDDNDDQFDENIAADTQTDSGGFSMAGIQIGDTDSKVMAQAIRTVLATED